MISFEKIPIHSVFAHFPIALLVSALILQMLAFGIKNKAWREAAWCVFVLLVFLTPLAVLSGLWEANRLNLHHPVVDRHRLLALLTMGGNFIAWGVLRKIRNQSAFSLWFILTNLLLVILVVWAAFYGGKMVYEYGIGVNR